MVAVAASAGRRESGPTVCPASGIYCVEDSGLRVLDRPRNEAQSDESVILSSLGVRVGSLTWSCTQPETSKDDSGSAPQAVDQPGSMDAAGCTGECPD